MQKVELHLTYRRTQVSAEEIRAAERTAVRRHVVYGDGNEVGHSNRAELRQRDRERRAEGTCARRERVVPLESTAITSARSPGVRNAKSDGFAFPAVAAVGTIPRGAS